MSVTLNFDIVDIKTGKSIGDHFTYALYQEVYNVYGNTWALLTRQYGSYGPYILEYQSPQTPYNFRFKINATNPAISDDRVWVLYNPDEVLSMTTDNLPNSGYYYFSIPEDYSQDTFDLTIHCLERTQVLTVNIRGNGVVKTSSSLTLPVEGTVTYLRMSEISANAYPGDGWRLDKWIGYSPGLIMDSDKTITAVFVEIGVVKPTANSTKKVSFKLPLNIKDMVNSYNDNFRQAEIACNIKLKALSNFGVTGILNDNWRTIENVIGVPLRKVIGVNEITLLNSSNDNFRTVQMYLNK